MSKQLKQSDQDVSPLGSSYELRDANETTSSSTVNVGYPMPNGHPLEHSKRMGGQYSDIAWNFFMLTIPMSLFVAFLIALIFHYQVKSNGTPFPDLRLPDWDQQDDRWVYYVRISSTILVFIASWSSSLAPTLASFALALMSWPSASRYLRAARAERTKDLMTPYQLFLTLRFLDGGVFTALWSWLRYIIGWRKLRERQTQSLSTTAFVAVLAVVLGVVIFVSDTWLHVTTKTVNFIQVTPMTSGVDYSFGLLPGCTTASNYSYESIALSEGNISCSLNIGGTNIFLTNGPQAVQVLNNVSSSMIVLTYDNTPYTYLGVPSSDTISQRDYSANTYGMQTQCIPVSTACNLTQADGADTPYHCSDAFHGDLSTDQNGFNMVYLTDGTMTDNETFSGIHNPYYFGVAAAVNQQTGTANGTLNYTSPEIVQPMHGGIGFVLNCSSTLYDIEYDSVNGTVTRFVKTPSNDSVANIWQQPVDAAGGLLVEMNLIQAATLGAYSTSTQELADKVALAYSRSALAIGAQVLESRPALAAQQREEFLVAKVHAAPLFTLIGANLLFVVLGVVLTAVALINSGGEVREVQARLSLKGLVADRFASTVETKGIGHMDDKFEEIGGRGSKRVGIDYAEGSGYSYRVWSK